MSDKTPKALLEALLFASPRPLPREDLARVSGIPEGETGELLAALAEEYGRDGRGFLLAEVAGGWQLRSRPQYAAEVARLRQSRPKSRFSRSAMETLALVAYRQPIQRSEIEAVRGVDCGATLKSLMAQGVVKVIGRKEAPGRPILYGTTDGFLQYFSLRDLESLPTLEEVSELEEGTGLPGEDTPAAALEGQEAAEPGGDAAGEEEGGDDGPGQG